MFGFDKKDVKLFVFVFMGICVFTMALIPPSQFQMIWDYLYHTPFIIVLGESGFLLVAAFFITVVLILARYLK